MKLLFLEIMLKVSKNMKEALLIALLSPSVFHQLKISGPFIIT